MRLFSSNNEDDTDDNRQEFNLQKMAVFRQKRRQRRERRHFLKLFCTIVVRELECKK